MSFDFGPMNEAVLATFANEVTIYVFGTKAIEGIYDSRHYEIDDGIAGGSALQTTISVRAADAADLVVAETELTVDGKIYRLQDKRPGGGGWVTLALERLERCRA